MKLTYTFVFQIIVLYTNICQSLKSTNIEMILATLETYIINVMSYKENIQLSHFLISWT